MVEDRPLSEDMALVEAALDGIDDALVA